MTTLQSHLPGCSSSGGSYSDNPISTLAHVFAVDRGWSIVTGLPPALRDEDCLVPSMMETLAGIPSGPSVHFTSRFLAPIKFIH